MSPILTNIMAAFAAMLGLITKFAAMEPGIVAAYKAGGFNAVVAYLESQVILPTPPAPVAELKAAIATMKAVHA
jgi:hypothetical protein